MVNQGRLAKVMLALMGSMTIGALVLLTLEGKPIKPMEFSLSSSQTQLTPIHTALGTESGVQLGRWQHIEVAYQQNNGQFSVSKGLTGSFAMQYHFLISDGSEGKDGQIFASHRWTQQQPCFDDSGSNTIRICLIGNPLSPVSTPNQARELEKLVSSLVRHCQLKPRILWRSR